MQLIRRENDEMDGVREREGELIQIKLAIDISLFFSTWREKFADVKQ